MQGLSSSGCGSAARLAEVDALLAASLGGGEHGTVALNRWSRREGLPGLLALGLQLADHAEVAEAAQSASSMKANPVPLSIEALRGILEAAA